MATTQTAKKKISLLLVRTILPTAQPERHFSALQGPQESRCLQRTRTRTGSDVTRPLAPHLDGQVPGASSHRGSLSWGSCVVAGPDPPGAAPITTASPSNSPGEKQESPEPKHVQVFGGSEAPGEDSRVVVSSAEFGQVGDLAAGDPRGLSQNIPGEEQREAPSRFSVWTDGRTGQEGASTRQEDLFSRLTGGAGCSPEKAPQRQ